MADDTDETDDTVRVFRDEDDPVTAYVQDTAVAGLRIAFIRLVPRGTTGPGETLSAHADVDLDADGQLIGVNLIFEDQLRSPDAGDDSTAASYTCPRCGRTSHNPNDIEQGYCGVCHDWTRDA